jgi:hypothetical protein
MGRNTMKILVVLMLMFTAASAQDASQKLWTKQNKAIRSPERTWYPKTYQSFSLDIDAMKNFLSATPMQKSAADHSSTFIIMLPMPDGKFQRFALVESPIMAPALAAQCPTIKTYAGQGIDDATATIRCDITDFGFHGYVLSQNGTVYIDPVALNDTRNYIIYNKKDVPAEMYQLNCLSDETENVMRDMENANVVMDGQLRKYRLALACTYEYAQHFGGQVWQARAAMVTTMNRVIGVYQKELAITMELIANNDVLIYTTPADPYSNNDGYSMLTENQVNIDTEIGYLNYDVGHVFSTGGGGVAIIKSVCGFDKASGVTGLSNPVGDPFDIDYVCHEMGHQFGANHTFNSNLGATACGTSGARIPSKAYEPGSGSTIMAYAGICGSDDLQAHTDAYFHSAGFDEIIFYTQSITQQGSGCPTVTNPGNNIPVVVVPSEFYVPISTAFRLSPVTANDIDGDPLTFCWEEWDTGPPCAWDSPFGDAATFRSFYPTTNPIRTFPWLPAVLHDSIIKGEVMASYARPLRFRCTVRDNRSGCGGVSHSIDSTVVHVVNADGPFSVTNPNVAGLVWDKSKQHTVFWDVAKTSLAPFNAPLVNIYLSTDGGYNFPYTIATQVDNSGAYAFYLPDTIRYSSDTSHWDEVRVMIEGDGAIFFDINDRSFRIDNYDILEPVDSSSVIKLQDNLIIKDSYDGYSIHFTLFSAGAANYTVSLYDLTGKLVGEYDFEKKYEKDERYIDISNLASGLYLARFDLPDGKQTKKFIKANYK